MSPPYLTLELSRCGHLGGKKNSCPFRKSNQDSLVVQPVYLFSYYSTDYANPVPFETSFFVYKIPEALAGASDFNLGQLTGYRFRELSQYIEITVYTVSRNTPGRPP